MNSFLPVVREDDEWRYPTLAVKNPYWWKDKKTRQKAIKKSYEQIRQRTNKNKRWNDSREAAIGDQLAMITRWHRYAVTRRIRHARVIIALTFRQNSPRRYFFLPIDFRQRRFEVNPGKGGRPSERTHLAVCWRSESIVPSPHSPFHSYCLFWGVCFFEKKTSFCLRLWLRYTETMAFNIYSWFLIQMRAVF